jgi:hypothetical protein
MGSHYYLYGTWCVCACMLLPFVKYFWISSFMYLWRTFWHGEHTLISWAWRSLSFAEGTLGKLVAPFLLGSKRSLIKMSFSNLYLNKCGTKFWEKVCAWYALLGTCPYKDWGHWPQARLASPYTSVKTSEIF